MPDTVFIHGAGGFIGSQLTRVLATRGTSVIASSRKFLGASSRNIESHLGELREPADFLPLLERSAVVVHLATASTPASTSGDPLAELHGNLQPTLALLQAMQTRPRMRLIYVSSAGSLYSPGAGLADENSCIAPRSYHGAGKIAAEQFIRTWAAQHDTRATILRPTNVYGPGQLERSGFAVIPTAFGKILRNETMTIWGDGSATRDFLFIDDFIALCVAVLDADSEPGVHAFNASNGESVSLNQLFAEIESVSGRPLKRTYEASRSIDATRIAVDSSAARQRFRWSPKIALHDGLERTWNWLTTIQH